MSRRHRLHQPQRALSLVAASGHGYWHSLSSPELAHGNGGASSGGEGKRGKSTIPQTAWRRANCSARAGVIMRPVPRLLGARGGTLKAPRSSPTPSCVRPSSNCSAVSLVPRQPFPGRAMRLPVLSAKVSPLPKPFARTSGRSTCPCSTRKRENDRQCLFVALFANSLRCNGASASKGRPSVARLASSWQSRRSRHSAPAPAHRA
jgi:hypothetical protein